MRWKGFSHIVHGWRGVSVFLFVSLFFVVTADCAVLPDIVPERMLKIDTHSGRIPRWQKNWQLARSLVRKGEYKRAASLYARLVAARPGLEIARWEYCQLLVFLGQYKIAAVEIEAVMALAPDIPEYRLVAGQIALHNGKPENAAQNFGAALEMAPTGEHAAAAMKGLAASLRVQGKKGLSLALEEQQMAAAFPERNAFLLLDDVLAVKDRAKLSWMLLHLPSLQSLSREHLQAAIALFTTKKPIPHSGEQTAGIKVYEELLRRFPQDGKLRRTYIDFLEKNNRFTKALAQFDAILDHEAVTGPLLLSAATFASEKAKSSGKALGYYKRYQVLQPDDKHVARKITQLYNGLAKEFLPIVENGGQNSLWLDIKEFGSSRQEIFLQMAAILKKRGDRESLQLSAALLQFLVTQKEAVYRASLALADVYTALGEEKRALAALKTIPATLRQAGFYARQAALLERQADEKGALEAYTLLLEKSPDRADVRAKAIILCDALGLLSEAAKFFTFYNQTSGIREKQRPPLATILLHLYFLGESRQVDSLAEMADWAANLWQDDPSALVSIRLEEARALRRMKMYGRAEGLLRKQLNRKVAINSILLALADTAAERGRPAEMEQWFRVLREYSSDKEKGASFTAGQKKLWRALIKARFFLQRQNPSRAAQFLSADIVQETSVADTGWQREAAAICQQAEQIEAKELYPFCRNRGEFPASAWSDAPVALYREKWKKTVAGDNTVGKPVRLSEELFSARQAVGKKSWHKAEDTLRSLRKKLPASLLVMQLLAESAVGQKEYEKAKKLVNSFPGDASTRCYKKLSIAQQEGRFAEALSLFRSCYGGIDDDGDAALAARLFAAGQPEEGVLLTRLLWRSGNYNESLSAYHSILATPVAEQIVRLYKQQRKEDFALYGQKSFWDFLSVFRSSKELQRQSYDALLSPFLLMENLGNPVGIMLATNSHLLFLQRILLQEYDARLASYEKRLLYAERSYRNLFAEDVSPDVIGDLVAIYERMGQYQKEALLYKKLQKRGGLDATLEKSMQRNSWKIKPVAAAYISFVEKEGHGQYQDIERLQIGSSFDYLPDLEKRLHLYCQNQQYMAQKNSGDVDVNSAGINMNWQFTERSRFEGGVGVDAQSEEISLLWHGRIESQLDDLVTGFLGIRRSRIEDTVESIIALEMVDDITFGLLFDTPAGISLGGDMRYRMRSDGNDGKEFHGTLAYSLFYEKSKVELSYDIYREENDRCNPSDRETSLLAPVSYWSPDGNTLHSVASRFRRTFQPFWRAYQSSALSAASVEESFVAAEAGVGIEEGNVIYFTDFDISLEISPYFLLKGSLGFLSEADREETDFSVAVQYRW